MPSKKDEVKRNPSSSAESSLSARPTHIEDPANTPKNKDLTSRRNFLTKSALAASGLMALPSVAGQGHEATSQGPCEEVQHGGLTGSLILQIPQEIKKAEGLLDAMEKDAALRQRFITIPATVLAERGFITSETPASISNANKVFLGIVTNNRLMAWIERRMPVSPPPPEVAEIFRKWAEEKGPLDVPPQYTASVVNEFARNERFMKGLITRLITDPAVSAALPAGIGKRELITLTTAGMREAARGAAAGTLPRLGAAGSRFGPSVVAGQNQAIFVFIPAFVIAVIIIAVAIHLFVFITGPGPLGLSLSSVRPILRDLSIELCGLTPGRP